MKGSCLCGGVVITTSDRREVSVCHCDMCRRWAGGPFMAVHCGGDVAFSGDVGHASYPSSDWAERGFCPKCGTTLFYHLLPTSDYALSAGLFDRTTNLAMENQIFIDEKPDFYSFANDTPKITGEEVFAQFQAEQD